MGLLLLGVATAAGELGSPSTAPDMALLALLALDLDRDRNADRMLLESGC